MMSSSAGTTETSPRDDEQDQCRFLLGPLLFRLEPVEGVNAMDLEPSLEGMGAFEEPRRGPRACGEFCTSNTTRSYLMPP